MRRLPFVLALLPMAAFAQLQLFEFDGTTELRSAACTNCRPLLRAITS